MIVQGPLHPVSIIPVKCTLLRAGWQFCWGLEEFAGLPDLVSG